jgi:hypothetical protein
MYANQKEIKQILKVIERAIARIEKGPKSYDAKAKTQQKKDYIILAKILDRTINRIYSRPNRSKAEIKKQKEDYKSLIKTIKKYDHEQSPKSKRKTGRKIKR